MTETRTLTAVFSDAATAERAIERLRAAGVPGPSIEAHPAAPEPRDEDGPAGGVFARAANRRTISTRPAPASRRRP